MLTLASFYSPMNDLDAKKIRAYAINKKKTLLPPPKVAKETTKPFKADNVAKFVTAITNEPIPTRKRIQHIVDPSNKRVRIKGLDNTTVLASQKKEKGCDF